MPEKIPEDKKKEIEKLVKELNYHCYRYYVLDSPVISDEEYDKLYEKMRLLSDFDPSERKQKYELCRKMEKIVTEDCPWIFGLNYYSYTLVHCWRKNFKPHPFAYNIMKYQSVAPELREKLVEEWNQPVIWPLFVLLSLFIAVVAFAAFKILSGRD